MIDIVSIGIVLLAIPLGLIAGLLPSIGITITLLMVYPLISTLSITMLLSFYVALMISSQFSGSVSALWLGLLGEPTSMPALLERQHIINNGLLPEALKRTAQSSAIASTASIIIIFSLLPYLWKFSFLLRTDVNTAVLWVIVVMSIFWRYNRILINITLVATGLVLSKVGYDTMTGTSFLTFGAEWLFRGIPFIPCLLGLYAVPAIIKLRDDTETLDTVSESTKSDIKSKLLLPTLRGTVVGVATGLIPMVGTALSSSISYWFESKLKNSTPLSRITAAEAANNSAVISVLVPLLLFGIAIQTSEVVILNIWSTNGFPIDSLNHSSLLLIVGFSIITCMVSYVSCFTYATSLVELLKKYARTVSIITVLILIGNIAVLGYMDSFLVGYIVTFVLSSVVGMAITKFDIEPTPLVFVWVLGDVLIPVTTRFFQLL